MKKIIVALVMLFGSCSAVAEKDVWHAFIYSKPEASKCERLREIFVGSDNLYKTIPDEITPENVAEIMERHYETISFADVARYENGTPRLVYAVEVGREEDESPSIVFAVFKGKEVCEKDRALAMSAKQEFLEKSSKKNSNAWHGYSFYNPMASECLTLKEMLLAFSENETGRKAFGSLPEDIDPETFESGLKFGVGTNNYERSGVLRDADGVPFWVFVATKMDKLEPELVIAVERGYANCEIKRVAEVAKRGKGNR